MDVVRQKIIDMVGDETGVEVSPDEVRPSPKGGWGIAFGFKCAKLEKRPPDEIAKGAAEKIKPSGIIKKVFSDGAYLNFELDYEKLFDILQSWNNEFEKKDEVILLEHTSVNPTGPFHVGRIRNTLIGDSLKRILKYSGYNVKTHYFVNDIGKQVAIISHGLESKVGPDKNLQRNYGKYSSKQDYEILFTYVGANSLYEQDRQFGDEVDSLIVKAESGDRESLEKITSAAKLALQGQCETLGRIDVEFDSFDFESEGLLDGSVDDILEKCRGSRLYNQGDVGEGLDLQEYGIKKRSGFSVLARSDGTSVYLLRDLAYHIKKTSKADKLINVLGEDHKLQFKELKTILNKVLGIQKKIEVVHFSFVNFEGVKFSTRKGDIATVDELLDQAQEKALEEIRKREIGDEKNAEIIGIGAVKFHIIKTTPNKQITFRWEDCLNFDGETAPYIQYAFARSHHILQKAKLDIHGISDLDSSNLTSFEEELIEKLLDFKAAVSESAVHLRPDLIASYLVDLTACFGRFYLNCPVLDSEEKIMKRRLFLVKCLNNTISDGLYLLGINSPDSM